MIQFDKLTCKFSKYVIINFGGGVNKSFAQVNLGFLRAIVAVPGQGIGWMRSMFLPMFLPMIAFSFLVQLSEARATVVGGAVAAAGTRQGSRIGIQKSVSPSLRLESMVVEVNGERRRVDPAVGFSVVRGDLVTVIDGWLLDKSKAIPLIDFVGFASKLKTSSQGDRGKVINTGRDLDSRQSIGGKGVAYEIRALGAGVDYGSITMSIEPPTLLSFEVEINGVHRKLGTGDRLRLGPRDGVRVTEILTNIRGNENVSHELASIPGKRGQVTKEIRFARGDLVFARIPIQWQEK